MKKLLALLAVIFITILIWNRSLTRFNKEVEGGYSYESDLTRNYIIPTDKGYLMVDTNYEKNYNKFKKYLEKNSIDIMDLKWVVLTHHHDDHIGFLSSLISEYPHIQVILNRDSVPLIKKEKNNTDNGGYISGKLLNTLFNFKKSITPGWDFTFPPYSVREVDTLLDGDYINMKDLIGVEGVIIKTPGHTSDSISLIIDDILYVGDLASNTLNWAGASNLTIFNESLEDVYKSWEKILELDIETIAPSHGKPFEPEALRRNIHKKSLKDLVLFE